MTNTDIALGIILAVGVIIGIIYLITGRHSELSKKSSEPADLKDEDNSDGNDTAKKQKPPEKDYSEIDAEIKEVTGWIGVSEPVDTSKMFEKTLDGKEKEVIDEIAKQLSLPMKVITKYSPKVKYTENGSTPLAEVSVGGIPHYGSEHLKDYPCVITLYPGYNSRSDRFIYVIAHELCHYVLQSLRPRLSDTKKEERLTDLAVIFGGFESAYRTGWQSYTHGNAGYYMDEFDIEYIRRRYESMLAARRQKFEKISAKYKELLKKQSDTLLFVKMCALLLDHPNEKIPQDDMAAVGRCFSLVGKKEIEKINRLKARLEPFSQRRTRYDEMLHADEDLAELAKLSSEVELPSADDIAILAKYTDKYC